jgi:hypothetical protein
VTTKLSKILVVGTVSNVASKLQDEFKRLQNELSKSSRVDYFLVESDSRDQTISLLNELSVANEKFSFQSFGELRSTIPDRIERIRYCRNAYVNYIRANFKEQIWDYIVVADMDGMNPKISSRGIESSIQEMNLWDGLFANQKYGYYDIFALRSEGWVERDLIKQLREEKDLDGKVSVIGYLRNQQKRQRTLYLRMRVISEKGEIIPVNSAFGGFGIYKPSLFLEFDYSLEPSASPDGSEHVTFHEKCTQAGYSLGINPRMINAHFNEYNVNKFYAIRFLKDFKRSLNRRKTRRDK